MTTLPHLTIGIPAYNEARNIAFLLDSILKQQSKRYFLNRIIVYSDGSTDDTNKIVAQYKEQYPVIELIQSHNRYGKAHALNTIYTLTSTELLLTLDADTVLKKDNEIDLMVEKMYEEQGTYLVGGRYTPVPQHTFMGKCSVNSYLSFEAAMLELNDGQNIYTLVGAASLIRKKLYKSFNFPSGTVSDQNYLYMKNKELGGIYKLAKKTEFYIRTVSTFEDWRLLGARSVFEDKENIFYYFGDAAREEYYMPRSLYFKSLIKFFIKSPIYTTGSVLMNIFIRVFPYKRDVVNNGLWELTSSSKEAITV